jgi:hypothetical protein
MAIWAAIPAIASIAGSLFGKKKSGGETVTAEQMMPEWQSKTGEQLAIWIQQYMGNFQPGAEYTGEFTAGPTSQETASLDMLTKFMGSSPLFGDLYSAGKGQIMDTLGGRYADPNESPFIKSMINLSQQNMGDMINQTRARRGARGTYYTKAGIQEEGDIAERSQNYLNSVIGEFINNERGRMFQAAPIAQAMDQYENLDAPIQKIAAGQSLGSLLRTIEQGDLEAQYQDFIRKREEMAMPIKEAGSLYGTSTEYGQKSMTAPFTESNSSFGNIADIISKLNFSGMGGSGGILSKLAGLFQK